MPILGMLHEALVDMLRNCLAHGEVAMLSPRVVCGFTVVRIMRFEFTISKCTASTSLSGVQFLSGQHVCSLWMHDVGIQSHQDGEDTARTDDVEIDADDL